MFSHQYRHIFQYKTQHFWITAMTNTKPTTTTVPIKSIFIANVFGCSFNDLTSWIIKCHVSLFLTACLTLTLICKANQWKRQGFWDVWPTKQPKLLFSSLFFPLHPLSLEQAPKSCQTFLPCEGRAEEVLTTERKPDETKRAWQSPSILASWRVRVWMEGDGCAMAC